MDDELTGRRRQVAIDEHLAWLDGNLPSEIVDLTAKDFSQAPLWLFMQQRTEGQLRRPTRRLGSAKWVKKRDRKVARG